MLDSEGKIIYEVEKFKIDSYTFYYPVEAGLILSFTKDAILKIQ